MVVGRSDGVLEARCVNNGKQAIRDSLLVILQQLPEKPDVREWQALGTTTRGGLNRQRAIPVQSDFFASASLDPLDSSSRKHRQAVESTDTPQGLSGEADGRSKPLRCHSLWTGCGVRRPKEILDLFYEESKTMLEREIYPVRYT